MEQPKERLRVSVNDGKYTVVMDNDCRLYALRNGEPWRDCVGDNLIYHLAREVEVLRKEIDELKVRLALRAKAFQSSTYTDESGESDAE